jgi:hypothetical protein
MPSPNGHRAERDGCTCPPWVLRCAHWEGVTLVMSGENSPNHHACARQRSTSNWRVVTVTKFAAAPCGCDLLTAHEWRTKAEFPNRDAADDEFDCRVAALLGREAE